MKRIGAFFNFHSLCILSGIFIGTSYIPFPPWASLFCFVPLWIHWFRISALNEPPGNLTRYKKIFFAGWLTQFVFSLIGFNWVALTVHEFGLMPWPIAIFVLLLFCAVANFDVPLAGVAWFYLHKKWSLSWRASAVLLATLMALFEAWIPTLFPWNYGYTWLWVKAPFAQVGEIVGFQGLSSIVILLNFGLLLFHERWRAGKTAQAASTLITTLGIFSLLNLAGYVLYKNLAQPDKEFKTVIVQANIGNLQKQMAEIGYGFRSAIAERYSLLTRRTLTDSALQDTADNPPAKSAVDFVVWPETAYPYDIDQRLWSSPFMKRYPPPAQWLINLAQELDTNLIAGGYGYAPRDGKVTNTFFIVEKSGSIQPDPYYKTILLAFGEYIPGSEFFPRLKEWIPAGDFSRGPGPQVKELSGLKIGPQICYESLFPSHSNRLADLGAEVFVNLTNDSWYGLWQEPYQHLYMTLARAIEFRRPLVRATNTGISTVVLASGEVLEKSPLAVEWTGLYTVPYKSEPKPTFYQLYPWLTDALLIFIILAIVGKAAFARFKKPGLERNHQSSR